MLGRQLLAQLDRENVVATFRSTPFRGGIRFDATRMRLRDSLLPAHRDIVAALILLGITKLDLCARDPAGTALVNVAGVKAVIDDLLEAGIKPVFASSDAVFDGSKGPWSEDDKANPILTYGRQKREIENYLQGKPGPWIVARLAKVIGAAADPRNLMTEWARQLENDEVIACATDCKFSPVDSRDAANAMVRLAGEDHTGIFHVAGPRAVLRIDLLEAFLEAVRRVRDFKPRITRCRLADIGFQEKRPIDLSMSPRKLCSALGIELRDPKSVCIEYVQRQIEAGPRVS